MNTLTASAAGGELDFRLLNAFQRDFPLVPRPFAAVAEKLGVDESLVIERLRALRADGAVSRVGAVFRPNVIGASALAALAVAPDRLERVAGFVSAFAEVNHNYQREHRYNLWFVATAPSQERLNAVFAEIEEVCESGPVLVLPMVEEYHIDLGFDLAAYANGAALPPSAVVSCSPIALNETERRMVAVLQEGLALVERPYSCLGLAESDALALIARWLDEGIVKRLGVIVRHHELGYTANAMTVWNVPDAQVSEAGQRIAAGGRATLCYRRERRLPDWPYNLFCMIHGKDRADVRARIAAMSRECGLDGWPRDILFSCRRFKQRGAHYAALPETRHG
ncbi:MAG TPA: AsnC family transcriptional regulator [Noviherbaspirillum sp.]|uniref:siroheme decarboxylase subunit beta n=1 Tax=Noviherbaspirillum sp. TaxID=1926288 RepID=UPI002D3C999E|nr:AsnC family transcriptional regulator [Noviherbaspirillum sp.]HYD93893.1 AsnC family transcriptional regulator [Noviherbaspirillum sp.]